MWSSQVLKKAKAEIIEVAIYPEAIIIRAINKFHHESSSLLELRKRSNSYESINKDLSLYTYKNDYYRADNQSIATLRISILSFI